MLTMAAIADHPIHHFTRFLSVTDNSNLNYLLYSTVVLSVLFPAYRFVLRDYQKFLDLGLGGTPSTFAGYLRVSCLRLVALKNPFIPPTITPTTLPQFSYLVHLPRRSGPRPTVAGIAPQRQTNQKGPPHLHAAMSRALHNLAGTYPDLLRKGNSCFEKHGLALFLLMGQDGTPHPGFPHVNQTCADTAEICHLHATVSTSFQIIIPVWIHIPPPSLLHLSYKPSFSRMFISETLYHHLRAFRPLHSTFRELFPHLYHFPFYVTYLRYLLQASRTPPHLQTSPFPHPTLPSPKILQSDTLPTRTPQCI